MPETACLHIQARDSDPIRVVELPGVSVRIGRASYCEVRLNALELADEECCLRRRGATWHLFPVATPCAATIEGRAVDRPRPLPFGVPLKVGNHLLILRAVGAAPPEWGTAHEAIAIDVPTVPRVTPEPLRPMHRGDVGPGPVVDRTPPRHDLRESRQKADQEQKRWEARWKAAGERLRSNAVATPPPPIPTPAPPAAEPPRIGRPDRNEWAAVPRRETAQPRKFTRPLEPTDFPAIKAVEPSLSSFPSIKTVERRPPKAPAPPREQPAPPAPAHRSEPVLKKADDRPRAALNDLAVEPIPSPFPLPLPLAEIYSVPALLPLALPLDRPAAIEEPERPSPPETTNQDEPPALRLAETDEPRTPVARRRVRSTGRTAKPVVSPVARTLGTAMKAPSTPTPRVVPASSPVRERDPGTIPQSAPERKAEAASEPTPVTAGWQAPAQHHWVKGSAQAPFVTDTHQTDPAAWARPAAAIEAPASSVVEPEWPSARDILAAHAPRATPRPESAARPAPTTPRRPHPTADHEPACWTLTGLVAWLPLLALALFATTIGLSLAWAWRRDDLEAGLAANYVAAGVPGARLPVGSDLDADTRWSRATGRNLAQRALALELAGTESENRERVEGLLVAAAQASPYEPAARYALARLNLSKRGAAENALPTLVDSLGLSRDTIALTWSGTQLVKAGKKESALQAYRTALELATHAELARLAPPTYNDDDNVRRYALPGEDLVGPVVRAMAGQSEWAYIDWSPALQGHPIAALWAARLLRDQSRIDSDAALDAVLGGTESDPLSLATRAEAQALNARWTEAEKLYQAAIDAMPNDRVKRAWLVNLADIELRLNNDPERQKALETARGPDPVDAIGKRVVDLQKGSGVRPDKARPSGTGDARVSTRR